MSKSYDRYITCPKHFFYTRCTERGYKLTDNYDCIIKKDGDQFTIDTHHPSYPSTSKRKQPIGKESANGGVGTELKKLLKMIGITASPGCSCNSRARRMDSEGIEWCKNNVELIVKWLGEESKKRRMPYAKFMGRKIVRMAIFRAERNKKK